MNNNQTTTTSIETNALVVGAVINFIMALSGWTAYYLSNSQALLLDGNYSFILFFSILFAIRIASIKSKRTELFPFGQFVYEALYSLLKGVMIIGMLLVAFTDNISRIFHFIYGGETNLLHTEVILTYALTMTFLCFSAALYYKYQNNKVHNASMILRTEYSAAKIDGFMSAGIGITLVGISLFNPNGPFGFLNYIGDAILVILLCVLLGKEPFVLVRDSFIEIAGGTIQNEAEKKRIEDILNKHLSPDDMLNNSYISKTGSSYLIVAYLNAHPLENTDFKKIIQIKEKIEHDLNDAYQDTIFEMVII